LGSLLAGTALVAGGMAAAASAETVAFYTFDTISGDTLSPGTERLFDSSGNNLDFNASLDFGLITLTTDKPAGAADGSYALNSLNGIGRVLTTPSTADLHRGTTGELTVEFWFKSVGLPVSYGW